MSIFTEVLPQKLTHLDSRDRGGSRVCKGEEIEGLKRVKKLKRSRGWNPVSVLLSNIQRFAPAGPMYCRSGEYVFL